MMAENNSQLKGVVKVLSASEVQPSLLHDFYKAMYPGRFGFIKDNWRWLNRTSYLNNKIPLVLVVGNRVIAHAGLIPVKITIDGNDYSAAWFIDLAVLPEFRGQGYGSILVKKREELTEMKMTFPNENSAGIFTKLSWQASYESYMHYVLIAPFNHPRFARLPLIVRKSLNFVLFSFISVIYKKHGGNRAENCLNDMDNRHLSQLRERYEEDQKNQYVRIKRDDEFINWRIQNSPNKKQYFIYSCNELYALIHMNESPGSNIDVLWVSDLDNKLEVRNMLSFLAITGKRKGNSFVRIFTTRQVLSSYLRRSVWSVVRIRKFFYNTENSVLLNKCKGAKWDLELIESDLEYTN